MIQIHDEKDCVGCKACAQICPRQCIDMCPDPMGFVYPKADLSKCIDCHLCEKVCPVINQSRERRPLQVFAAKNPSEEERLKSSSGGVFIALARAVIDDGGVVFGATFDNDFNVRHKSAVSIEGAEAFQGSKYVQSDIGHTYLESRKILRDGHRVLFSGTPCQIAGLKLFLGEKYDDLLICVDTVCHGVPGPFVWQSYLTCLTEQLGITRSEITSLTFRDKRLGWRRFGLSLHSTVDFYEPLDQNPYIQAFLKNLDLRPSCYDCPAKCGKSHSDITLADFWKLRKFHAEIFDETGVSLLMVNTPAGADLIEKIDLLLTPSSYDNGLYGNPSIEKSAVCPPGRKGFVVRWQTNCE